MRLFLEAVNGQGPFPALRVVWGPCKAAPNRALKPGKSYTVKITSGHGILGWDGTKLNREEKQRKGEEYSTVLKQLFAIDAEISLFSV